MMSTFKTTLAVAAALLAGSAMADTLPYTSAKVNLTGFSNGSAVVSTSGPAAANSVISAGGFKGTLTPAGGTATAFTTYCTDLLQAFSWKTSYTYSVAATGTPHGFTATQETLLGKLYTLAGTGVDSTDESVAFQTAIWEILYENSPNLSLAAGSFMVTWSTGNGNTTTANANASQLALANSWLSSIAAGGVADSWDATRLFNASAQDFVVFTRSTTDNSSSTSGNNVPEPASLALVALALGGMGLTARRRKAA